MNLPLIHSDYIERYGEDEGLVLFNQFLNFMIETTDFPNCLEYCEYKRELNENNKTSNA